MGGAGCGHRAAMLGGAIGCGGVACLGVAPQWHVRDERGGAYPLDPPPSSHPIPMSPFLPSTLFPGAWGHPGGSHTPGTPKAAPLDAPASVAYFYWIQVTELGGEGLGGMIKIKNK